MRKARRNGTGKKTERNCELKIYKTKFFFFSAPQIGGKQDFFN